MNSEEQAAAGAVDIEQILADFRSWLQQVADSPIVEQPNHDVLAPIDLATVVAQFTALRHEVNLQTRASRTAIEQNGQTLAQLSQTLDTIQQPDDSEDAVRPLLKALVEARDALALAHAQVRKLQDRLEEPPPPPEALDCPGWLRLLGVEKRLRAAAEAARSDLSEQSRATLNSILVGYTMSDRDTTVVIEEVRPGYIYRDQLFRTAHVRVSAP